MNELQQSFLQTIEQLNKSLLMSLVAPILDEWTPDLGKVLNGHDPTVGISMKLLNEFVGLLVNSISEKVKAEVIGKKATLRDKKVAAQNIIDSEYESKPATRELLIKIFNLTPDDHISASNNS